MASGPLQGLRVLDVSTLFAGPIATTVLGDFGAEVLKIEHPRLGDPARGHGYARDGISLTWKTLSRNKRTVTLQLSEPRGRDVFLDLVATADVVVENFRPGTLERWGLGPDALLQRRPDLVLARVTGFGQQGPLSKRPGFGTLAESMSGFAHSTGYPDGPPTLPPFGLADGIAAYAAAFGILAALRHRDATGEGQTIDLAIIEPILSLLGPQVTVYEQLGIVQQREGNRSVNNAPRNIYLTRDERWVAISTSAQSIAERVMRLVGRPELIDEPWFATGRQRAEHADELDEAVGAWIAERDLDQVVAEFEAVDAAVAPIYDAADIARDPQYAALGTFVELDDPELGPLVLQNVMMRLSRTPGAVEWAGRQLGADTDAVLAELGVDEHARAELRADGII